jgi:hypothetical protein
MSGLAERHLVSAMATGMNSQQLADWQARLSALECNHYMFEHQIHCDVHFR